MVVSTIFAVMLGMLSGVGLFTFGYGKGYSYLMSNPTTCTNCHVMQANYDSWEQSHHRMLPSATIVICRMTLSDIC